MQDARPTVGAVRVRAVNAPMPLPLQTSSGALTTAPLVLIDPETSARVVGRSYLFAFTSANLKPIAGMGALIAGDPSPRSRSSASSGRGTRSWACTTW